jgi:hypothetical protein
MFVAADASSCLRSGVGCTTSLIKASRTGRKASTGHEKDSAVGNNVTKALAILEPLLSSNESDEPSYCAHEPAILEALGVISMAQREDRGSIDKFAGRNNNDRAKHVFR